MDHSDGMGGFISGGMDTARSRTPANAAEAAARAAVHADAFAYLNRKGLADGDDSVAAILGLTAGPERTAEPHNTSARPCAQCGADYIPSAALQITCSRSCGGKHAHARRRAYAQEAAKTTTGGTPC